MIRIQGVKGSSEIPGKICSIPPFPCGTRTRPPVLQFVLSVLESDRILFAANYPPESALEAARFIDSIPMSDIEKEKICHPNAERLLRL